LPLVSLVLLILVANLPLVSMIRWQIATGINDTGGEIAVGANDTGGK
jgi:hypothetical protein